MKAIRATSTRRPDQRMTIDAATARFLAQIAGGKPLELCTPEEARRFGPKLAALNGPGPAMARIEEHVITRPDGAFTLRVYVPQQPARAVMVYSHGGGWVTGTLDEYDTLARKLAERCSCAVVLPDYRLAPEHPFPVPFDDAFAALEWAASQRQRLAIGNAPLLIAGDSAGGNLSAAMALRARDAGGPAIALQILIYPATDTDFDRPSYVDPANQLMLTRSGARWFWEHYVPDPAQRRDWRAAPLHAASLAGLPPAVVLTAEHDVLLDEGAAYAERLRAAGVSVDYRCHWEQTHGFFSLLFLPGSEAGFQQVVKAVRACIVANTRPA